MALGDMKAGGRGPGKGGLNGRSDVRFEAEMVRMSHLAALLQAEHPKVLRDLGMFEEQKGWWPVDRVVQEIDHAGSRRIFAFYF